MMIIVGETAIASFILFQAIFSATFLALYVLFWVAVYLPVSCSDTASACQ